MVAEKYCRSLYYHLTYGCSCCLLHAHTDTVQTHAISQRSAQHLPANTENSHCASCFQHTKWQNVSNSSDENRLWALRDTCRHQRSLLAAGLESSCWMTSGTKTHHILSAQRGSSSFNMNAIISRPQLLTHIHTDGNLTDLTESLCIRLILLTTTCM